METISDKHIKAPPPSSWLRRYIWWLLLPPLAGGAWFAYVLLNGINVYARNQGDPWRNFDTDQDGIFTRAEVEELYGMDDGIFAFCDEDGDGRLTRAEFGNVRSHAGDWDAMNAGKTKKAARALYLLQRPSPVTATIIDAFQINGERRIRRNSAGLADFFWTDPRFVPYNLDPDNDGLITEGELAAAAARGARPEASK
ncbi:MAG: hypothetical protein A2X31_07120 [Elusimicrobia bacterium GWB2_63_22]|nr:MAG: hypothetical protein A2X31_07120 [Elusimicrobia bacterium GWB2_63_22]